MRRCLGLLAILVLTSSATAGAQTSPAAGGLAGITFLIGTWSSGAGKVADTGETSRGSSTIAPEAGGAVLLRRDHTQLFDAGGKPSGSFDQIMMIYPEGGTLRADYSDGEHVIHYTSATIVPGTSVTFHTAIAPGSPSYRLSYEMTDPQTLAVRFEFAPPGQSAFRPIASGTLQRSSPPAKPMHG